jgi:hypothetical protein
MDDFGVETVSVGPGVLEFRRGESLSRISSVSILVGSTRRQAALYHQYCVPWEN